MVGFLIKYGDGPGSNASSCRYGDAVAKIKDNSSMGSSLAGQRLPLTRKSRSNWGVRPKDASGYPVEGVQRPSFEIIEASQSPINLHQFVR